MTSESHLQLTEARAAKWHHDATPLLTLEALRTWLTASGLVLYTSRTAQLPSPAPSFVEATLGTPNAEPTLAEVDNARGLLARLISDGAALPLNLLGVAGSAGTDIPDFIVSAQVFSYVFTLRGNKAWKQPPGTSGPVKVSPLAAAAYEILTAKISLSAYDLTTELGKEVTESAVLRALTELWGQLRVIPVPQQDGTATLWELTSTRFTKQIKAGANAGQPSALSALISLYLGQALAATEDEVETFLSPLAPRSRVRDVLHALLSARQLETLVIDGKTLLHVAGELPAFLPKPAAAESEAETTPPEPQLAQDGSRIRKFTPKPGSKIGTGLRSKPAFKKPFGKPSFGSSPDNRERRPFQRDAKPAFNKPWDEEKAARTSAPASDLAASADTETPQRPAFTPRPPRPASGARPSFGGRPSSGGTPRFEGRREGFGGKQQFGRENGAGPSRSNTDRPSRPYTPRPSGPASEGNGDAPRRTFSKPGTFGRKREGFSPATREGSDARPPRRDFTDRPARPDRAGGSSFKRPGSFTPRSQESSNTNRPERAPFPRENAESASAPEAPRKIFRKFDAPRTPKPFGAKPFGKKPITGSSPAGDRPARPFNPDRPARPYSDRPARPNSAARPYSADRPARPFNADRPNRASSDRPGSDRPRSEGRPAYGAKPSSYAGKKPFGASSSTGKPGGFAKAGGPFAKFADGKKPFRKPGPGTSRAAKPSGGGFKPTRRNQGGA